MKWRVEISRLEGLGESLAARRLASVEGPPPRVWQMAEMMVMEQLGLLIGRRSETGAVCTRWMVTVEPALTGSPPNEPS